MQDKAPNDTAYLPDPKFTEGPWTAYSGGDSAASNPLQAWHVTGPARVYQDRSLGFAADDARLIAAAPEMHDAIEQALDDMAESHCVCEATKQMLHAALTKARR